MLATWGELRPAVSTAASSHSAAALAMPCDEPAPAAQVASCRFDEFAELNDTQQKSLIVVS
jgi:hypothetical protein